MTLRLRIGFIPIAGAEEPSAPVQQLVVEVGRLFGGGADAHRAADYRGLLAALEKGVVHIAWVPPLIAARSVIARSIQPVALAIRDGSTSYSAALITRRTSPIRSPRDLKGARAAWVDRESASGYSMIRMALRASGVSLVDAFGEEIFARSHGEVARLVVSGAVDVGATYVNYLPDQRTMAGGGWTRVEGVSVDDVRIIAEAGPIPCDFIAVHRALPPDVVDTFTAALVDGHHGSKVNLHAKALLRADGFIRASSEHVAMLQDLVQTLDPPRSKA